MRNLRRRLSDARADALRLQSERNRAARLLADARAERDAAITERDEARARLAEAQTRAFTYAIRAEAATIRRDNILAERSR